MWQETELFIQQNKLLCNSSFLLTTYFRAITCYITTDHCHNIQTGVTLILLAARHSHFKCTRSFSPSMVKMLFFAKFNVVSPWRRAMPYIRSNWLCVTDSWWTWKIILQKMKIYTVQEQHITHTHTHAYYPHWLHQETNIIYVMSTG
jgi:hypothetical protein